MMEKIKNLLTAKKPWLLFVLGLAGIGLIFLSSFVPQTEQETETDVTDPAIAIEQRLEQTISRIKGAGETHVMVTLSDTGSKVYLSEEEEREEYGGETGVVLHSTNIKSDQKPEEELVYF